VMPMSTPFSFTTKAGTNKERQYLHDNRIEVNLVIEIPER